MSVPILRSQNPTGLVRLSAAGLSALLTSNLPFVGVVTGPNCPRCTAFKAALEPVLKENNLLVFEVPYFETYRPLRPEIRAQRATPRVYAFPTLLLLEAGKPGEAIPWNEDGVNGLMKAFEEQTIPSETTLVNEVVLKGCNRERHPTLDVPEATDVVPLSLDAPLPSHIKLVTDQGRGVIVPAEADEKMAA